MLTFINYCANFINFTVPREFTGTYILHFVNYLVIAFFGCQLVGIQPTPTFLLFSLLAADYKFFSAVIEELLRDD